MDMYMNIPFKIRRWDNFTYRGDACSRKTFQARHTEMHYHRAILKCFIVALLSASRHHDGGIFFWQSTGKSQEEACSTREVSSTRENIKERTSFFGSNQTCLTSTSWKSNPP